MEILHVEVKKGEEGTRFIREEQEPHFVL